MNCIDCENCLVVQDIPQCTTILNVCDNPSLSGTTYVYIQNLANGHINKHTATISNGYLQIPIEYVLMPECSYVLWINNTLTTPMDQAEITVDNFQTYCIRFDVFRYYNLYYDGISDFTSTFQVKQRD